MAPPFNVFVYIYILCVCVCVCTFVLFPSPRSAKEFVCLSAPLVEDIPDEVNFCEMRSESDAAKDIHNEYDIVADGFITKSEFLESLTRMGLTFDEDSLDLNENQQKELLDHVFKFTDKSFALEALTYERFESQLKVLAPYFTTLYDSAQRRACLADSPGSNECSFNCTASMSNRRYGVCDPAQGCVPGCGNADVVLRSSGDVDGDIDYHHYDTDPPDGYINYEEFRQALLKIYGNCTYIIEPRQQDYLTCEYVGGGQYDVGHETVGRRVCTSYRGGSHAQNSASWRWENQGLINMDSGYRECRPFPDYDPRLNGIAYDPNCTDSWCFLADGTRAPASYYNRSTWSTANYDRVRFLLQAVFPRDSKFFNQPYFNISNDDEFREFAGFFFSKTEVYEQVDYETFNNNMQSLQVIDGIGSNFYLFNPECHKGKFMKVKPDWHLGQRNSADYAIRFKSNGAVEDTQFPNFAVNGSATSAAGNDIIGACSSEWGNPDFGIRSTFSYFRWADSTSGVGYKWGRALPSWCLDERWPDGGVGGTYPLDYAKYGAKAGAPIPPGCEPMLCSAHAEIDASHGSIHAQTLPFSFDAHNETGLYRTMIDQCNSTVDGSSHCFYKGYEDTFTLRLNSRSEKKLDEWRDNYGKEDDADFMGVITPRGHGIPNFAKWFWTTRSIYLEFEPSWVRIFSGTVLGPEIERINVHVTPGTCDAKYGAVEAIDWRDPCFRPSTLALSPSTVYGPGATDEQYCSTLVSEDMRSLREKREAAFFIKLRKYFITDESIDIRGSMAKRTVNRALYNHEHLYRSAVTASGLNDVLNTHWRHKKVCIPNTDCFSSIVHVDNCLVQRQAVLVNATSGRYALTPCMWADGVTSACASGDLLPNGDCSGLSINETAYLSQFGASTFLRNSDDIKDFVRYTDIYERWAHAQQNTRYPYTNLTTFYEHFSRLGFSGAEYEAKDLHDSWWANEFLFMCVIMSFIIAALLGMLAMYVLATIGIRKLDEVGDTLRKEEIVKNQNRRRKRDKVIELLEVKYAIKAQDQIRDLTFDDESSSYENMDPQVLKFSQAKCDEIEEFMTENGWNDKTLVASMNVDDMANAYLRMEAGDESSVRMLKLSGYGALVGNTVGSAMNWLQDTYLFLSDKYRHGSRFEKAYSVIGLSLLSVLVFVKSILSKPFPSPFATVEKFVRMVFRIYMVDSVRAFIRKKCIVDHELDIDEVVNLGGSLMDLPEFIKGKRVIRLGLHHEVGIARTIMGRHIRYRVKHVKITVREKTTMNPETKKNITYLTTHVEEGKCTFINDTIELRKWEEKVAPLVIGQSRSYTIPHVLDTDGNGGRTVEFVTMGHKYTRTVQIDCSGSPTPNVRFKTILRNVTPAYSKFCNDHGFFERDLKRYDKKFEKINVKLSMRLQTFVRGVKLKTRLDKEEEKKELRSMLTLCLDRVHVDDEEELSNTNDADSQNSAKDKLAEYIFFAKSANKSISTLKTRRRRSMNMADKVTSGGGFMIGNENLLKSTTMSHLDTVGGHQHHDDTDAGVGGGGDGVDSDDDDDDDDDTASQSSGGSYEEECTKTALESLAPDNKLAVFILAQYKYTNQGMDVEEIEVFKTRFQKWCKKNDVDHLPIDEAALEEVGLKLETKHFFDVYGLVVSERRIVDNVDGYNVFVSLSMQVLIVLGQLALIILPPIVLIAAVLGQQRLHKETVAMFPVLEYSDLQQHHGFESLTQYGLTDATQLIFYLCLGFYLFGTAKLIVYYISHKYDKSWPRTMLKSLFYMFLILILSMTVSYIFLIISWLILGAVIKPEVFLPYCVGTMTVGAYARTKLARVTELYHKYKTKAMAVAGAAFTVKVAQALRATQAKSGDGGGESLIPDELDEPYEIFTQCCSQDDVMSFDDFSTLLDRIGVDLIEDKRRMFFAQVDKDGSGHLQYREFEEAWTFLQSDAAERKLRELGITRSKLVAFGVGSVVILSLIIVFIFIGVATFIGAGTLGAVVNSALTASSAVAMASKGEDEDEENDKELEKIEI